MTFKFSFSSRGTGQNWLPCFICGHKPVHKCQADLAAYVDPSLVKHVGEKHFHEVGELFHEVGLLIGEVDFRAHEPHYVQVKLGACGEHEPNLMLLDWQLQMGPNKGFLTRAMLECCIPGRKIP